MQSILKKASFIIIIFLLSVNCWGKNNNFQSVNWGMSKLEVLSSEPLNPETFNATHISYETTVLGKNMQLIYYFIDNKHIRVRYLFVTKNRMSMKKYTIFCQKNMANPEFRWILVLLNTVITGKIIKPSSFYYYPEKTEIVRLITSVKNLNI